MGAPGTSKAMMVSRKAGVKRILPLRVKRFMMANGLGESIYLESVSAN